MRSYTCIERSEATGLGLDHWLARVTSVTSYEGVN